MILITIACAVTVAIAAPTLSLIHISVEGFKEKDNGVEVLLKDNPSLQADMVVLAIGVTPDTALAKEAGLELGIKGSIVVNDLSLIHICMVITS